MSVYNPRDLVEGPLRLWEAAPANAVGAPAPPLNTAGTFGSNWPAGWRNPGYTSRDPLQFGGLSSERTAVFSGQQRGQVASFAGEVNENVTFRVMTRTLENLSRFAGRGTLSQINAGSGTPGEIRVTWEDTPPEQRALGLEGYGTNGRLFRAYYPIGTFAITDNVPYGFGAENAQAGMAVTYSAEGGPDYPAEWWEVLPAL